MRQTRVAGCNSTSAISTIRMRPDRSPRPCHRGDEGRAAISGRIPRTARTGPNPATPSRATSGHCPTAARAGPADAAASPARARKPRASAAACRTGEGALSHAAALADTHGLGRILLVQQRGTRIVYLNELRHQAGAALSLSLDAGLTTLPAVYAARGDTRAMEGIDYRGLVVMPPRNRFPARIGVWSPRSTRVRS